MDTNNISTTYANLGITPKAGGVARIDTRESAGNSSAGKSQLNRSGGGNPLAGSVLQTMGQLGVNLPQQPAGKPTPSETSLSTSTGGGSVKQALHSFMHDLYQASRSSTAGGASPQPEAKKSQGASYEGLASKLQGLAQQAGSGNGNEALGKLKTSFDNLVKELSSSATSQSSASAAKTPTLQEFLQKLSGNLPDGGQSPLGSLVNTAA